MDKENLEDFKKQKYTILRSFVSQEMVDFLFLYGRMRRKVALTMIKTGYADYRDHIDGTFMDKAVPGSYSVYSDPAMETLLSTTLPRLNEMLGMSLVSTYTYWRMYKSGDVLKRHKDRASCEVSATICIGYDSGDEKNDNWPIFIDSPKENTQTEHACKLYPGDLMVYRGSEVEHWREKFEGKTHMQVFMHFNDAEGAFGSLNQYDCRPHLGLPEDFRKKKPKLF